MADPAHTALPAQAGLPLQMDPRSAFGRLFREGYRFEFFQAVRLLEAVLAASPGPVENGVEHTRVQLRPSPDLVFPAADVKKVEWVREAVARVTVTFMGLYGVDAPLPSYFYNDIAAEEEGVDALKDFLDMFNQRLYEAFYDSWKKYRYALHFERSYQNPHAQVFLSLAGLSTPGALASLAVPPLRLAAFAGYLGCRVRNADGLQALLTDLLEEMPLRVVENVPRWVPIAERMGLGSKAERPGRLGEMVVGTRISDRSGKFRLVLGPLTFAQYESLLPGSEQAHLVQALVRLYAPDYLDYDVELLLDTAEVPPLRLGERRLKMGRNTWVGRPAGAVVSDIVEYDRAA